MNLIRTALFKLSHSPRYIRKKTRNYLKCFEMKFYVEYISVEEIV